MARGQVQVNRVDLLLSGDYWSLPANGHRPCPWRGLKRGTCGLMRHSIDSAYSITSSAMARVATSRPIYSQHPVVARLLTQVSVDDCGERVRLPCCDSGSPRPAERLRPGLGPVHPPQAADLRSSTCAGLGSSREYLGHSIARFDQMKLGELLGI